MLNGLLATDEPAGARSAANGQPHPGGNKQEHDLSNRELIGPGEEKRGSALSVGPGTVATSATAADLLRVHPLGTNAQSELAPPVRQLYLPPTLPSMSSAQSGIDSSRLSEKRIHAQLQSAQQTASLDQTTKDVAFALRLTPQPTAKAEVESTAGESVKPSPDHKIQGEVTQALTSGQVASTEAQALPDEDFAVPKEAGKATKVEAPKIARVLPLNTPPEVVVQPRATPAPLPPVADGPRVQSHRMLEAESAQRSLNPPRVLAHQVESEKTAPAQRATPIYDDPVVASTTSERTSVPVETSTFTDAGRDRKNLSDEGAFDGLQVPDDATVQRKNPPVEISNPSPTSSMVQRDVVMGNPRPGGGPSRVSAENSPIISAKGSSNSPEQTKGDSASGDTARISTPTDKPPVNRNEPHVHEASGPVGLPIAQAVDGSRTSPRNEREPQNSPSQAQAPNEPEINLPVRPQPMREISLQLQDSSAQVNIQFAERAGHVQVAVRTPDQELTKALQTNIGDLVGRLEERGFKTETWMPAAAIHVQGTSAGTNNTSNHQDQTGHPGSWDGGQQERQDQQESGRRHQPPRWMNQFEQTLKDDASTESVGMENS